MSDNESFCGHHPPNRPPKQNYMKTIPPVKQIALFGNPCQEGYLCDISDFIRCLADSTIKVVIEESFSEIFEDEILNLPGISKSQKCPDDVQCVISMGGDGTFIRAVAWTKGRDIPLIGINTGHLGFMADNAISSIPEIIHLLKEGKLEIEERTVLELTDTAITPDIPRYALNEIAIQKEETASMINVNVKLNDIYLSDYKADGLIVSTPTGSTAYNLSVGGPIVDPTMDCMILSPIAPHSLTLRPMVVRGDSIIDTETTGRARKFRVSIDGFSTEYPTGTKLTIRKADFTVKVLRRPGDNFAGTLRCKLHWGV